MLKKKRYLILTLGINAMLELLWTTYYVSMDYFFMDNSALKCLPHLLIEHKKAPLGGSF